MAIVEIVLLLAALAVLAKSTEWVIEGAVKLADFFRIGHVAIGFLLISVSTSLPEFMVSVVSGIQNEGAIAVGNVFGSNIADVLLILGLGAFFYGIRPRMEEWKEVSLVVLGATVITVALISIAGLDRVEGIVLLLLFLVYCLYMLRKRVDIDVQNHVTQNEALRAFLRFGIGMAVVLVSAAFAVDQAVVLAQELGLAKSFIGATIVAVGTSLPELAVDVQALRKKKYGLALGDAIGSTMANLTLVLGVAPLFHAIPLKIPIFLVFMAFSILANMVLFYFVSIGRKLERKEGAVLLVLYILYLLVIFHAQVQNPGV